MTSLPALLHITQDPARGQSTTTWLRNTPPVTDESSPRQVNADLHECYTVIYSKQTLILLHSWLWLYHERSQSKLPKSNKHKPPLCRQLWRSRLKRFRSLRNFPPPIAKRREAKITTIYVAVTSKLNIHKQSTHTLTETNKPRRSTLTRPEGHSLAPALTLTLTRVLYNPLTI